MARYQALICTVTYTATGNLDQSKDLAQETFLTAWKRLADLREPEESCGRGCAASRAIWSTIRYANKCANPVTRRRNRSRRFRKAIRRVRVTGGDYHQQRGADDLVAFAGKNVAPRPTASRSCCFIARTNPWRRWRKKLELTPDAVHQRLSRGRKLLAEEVLAFVEGALARTAPGLRRLHWPCWRRCR